MQSSCQRIVGPSCSETAMLSAVYAVVVCLSVRVSVTLRYQNG